MIRHRLVRQRAVSVSSGSESTASMSSPPPLRRRKNSQDTKMFRRKSSESLDQLLKPSSAPPSSQEVSRSRSGGRRHSVACGVLYVDAHRPSIKSAFNSAVRRMSDACSLLSSAPSSTYNLSAPQPPPPPRKENEVILPSVLRTYRPPPPRSQSGGFQVNRRFSTDCPPPSYSEATGGWKHSAPPKQKLLVRQNDVVTSKPTSLVAVEDDDVVGIREQN